MGKMESKMKLSFASNNVEQEKFDVFHDEHNSKCKSSSATGEKYKFTIVPTSLGLAWSVKCMVCNIEENITDYESWLVIRANQNDYSLFKC